ncbi:putative acyl carrier protein, mitochondrial isoform X2 [Apostichopus japonicus]|uniref:Acyl carrier protein n=1 Tax=Stichopus japonicus TaxID=307972 RepID=A0A2G8LNA2_STIJA|nr:putative acyl carrier protein, mitochondrial isoform X2 [Apostichopus japonicus]
MAAVCRIRTVLQKAAALQRLTSVVVKTAPRCSSTLVNNRPYHSFNCIKPLDVVRPSVAVTCLRHYADLPQLTFDQIEARTLNLLKLFDKVDPDKVTVSSHFIDDMGLDSLDVVEIVMAIEDEFGVEINDEEAEKILTVKDAIELLGDKFDVVE